MVPTRVLLISVITNIALTLLKVIGGLLAGSAGLVADGFHSLTDVIAMMANYFGIRISLQPANGLEAYDNYKKEIMGTFVVSFVLFVVGLFILVRSYLKLITGVAHSPGLGAGLIVIVAFVITCWLYSYSNAESTNSDSPGLAINTEQIKLNLLSTVAVLIGIVGSCFDMNYLDAVAAIFVALIILYSSVGIIFKFIREVEQARLSPTQINEITSLVAQTDEQARVARLKTMAIRKKIWLLLELADSPDAPLTAGLIGRMKANLLSNLLYLDNVIIGLVPPREADTLKVEIEDFGRELGVARNYLTLACGVALILVVSASAFGMSLLSREYHVLLPAEVADVSSGVPAQFGRARYFYVYRVDKTRGRFIENRLAFSPYEIDRRVAKLFKDYSVEAIVTRNVGPHLFEELNRAGISMYRAEPNVSIRGQIERFRQEKLNKLAKPNVDVKFGLKNLRLLSPWYNWQPR